MLRRALRGHSYPILSGNGNLGKKGLLSCEVKAVMANPYDDEKKWIWAELAGYIFISAVNVGTIAESKSPSDLLGSGY